ncbi:MAG: YwiC-like family protein [Acidimicrobiales bacterium]
MPSVASAPQPRSSLRAVAVPAEHGGWALSAEPGLLALAVAPSLAGLALAVAALVLFLVRTPARAVAVGRRRGRWTTREQVAARVAAVEVAALGALVVVAAALGEPGWWWPGLVALVPGALAASYEVRSRDRRLVPELAGAVAVVAVAPMAALAGGASTSLAIGLWLVLAARSTSSIPHAREQVGRVHGRAPTGTGRSDLVAIVLGAAAVLVEPALATGAASIVAIVIAQRALARRPVPRVAVVGATQVALGVAVVSLTALGVALG